MKIKRGIFIVEDHEVFRLGLRELISREEDLFVCGEADNSHDALRLIRASNPSMAIIDISLKDTNGIMLIKDLRKCMKDLPLLVLSMFDEALYAQRALAAGAQGYIMKQETSDSIIGAIRHILKGYTYVSQPIMEALVAKMPRNENSSELTPICALTDRELEIFSLIGSGLSTGEIAKRLNLNVKTIGTYRERIKEKLNIKRSSDLIKHAALWLSEQQTNK